MAFEAPAHGRGRRAARRRIRRAPGPPALAQAVMQTDQRTAWLSGALGPAAVGPRGAVAGIQLVASLPGGQFSVFAGSKLTRPTPVRATDGRIHLVYELVLTSTAGFPVAVDQVGCATRTAIACCCRSPERPWPPT